MKIHWPKFQSILALAEALGVKENTRLKWRQRGVPYRWRVPILRLADERGVDLDYEDMDPPAAKAA